MKNFYQDRNIVITGATSGLGRALALRLHHLGAHVAGVARGAAGLASLRHEAPRALTIQADVSRAEEIYPLAGEIQAKLGDVDILFNVASDLGPVPLRLLADTECEDFERALRTNVLGPHRLTRALLAPMLLRGSGLVVNVSSDAAVNAYPRWGAYGASKAAVDHLSRVLDEELKEAGVRCLSVDPGDMRTPMHFAAVPDADPARLRDPAESAERLLELIARNDFSQVRRIL